MQPSRPMHSISLMDLIGVVTQKLVLKNGNYEEFEEWIGSSDALGTDGVIGAGTCGKCIVAIDMTTKERFCIKIVRTVAFVYQVFRALV